MRRVVATVVVALLVGGCSGSTATTGPPEIVYGRDICMECGMLITEERFASAYRIDGETRLFDDIGGMLLYGVETEELPAAESGTWVHDHDTRDWLPAPDAWFVVAEGTVTPMGYGVVAFADRERAQAFAIERDGEVVRWHDLFEFSIEPGRLSHIHTTNDDGDVREP